MSLLITSAIVISPLPCPILHTHKKITVFKTGNNNFDIFLMFYSQKGKEIYSHQFPDACAVLYPHSVWLGSKIQMDGDAKSQKKNDFKRHQPANQATKIILPKFQKMKTCPATQKRSMSSTWSVSESLHTPFQQV